MSETRESTTPAVFMTVGVVLVLLGIFDLIWMWL